MCSSPAKYGSGVGATTSRWTFAALDKVPLDRIVNGCIGPVFVAAEGGDNQPVRQGLTKF